MTLNKIIAIKNIGRFFNAAASGDVTHQKNTLIFAPNGRGKTTLCAVMRSLQSGEPAYIIGRRTLGVDDPPEVRLLLGSGPASFTNGQWNTTLPKLAVFDATYITENVYSGEAVDTEQRRNLYRVIIGSDGVAMVRRLDDLEGQLRTKNTEIREARAQVQQHMPPGMNIDEFLTLPQDQGIDQKIGAKERELEAVKRADQIQQRASLEEIILPQLPEGLTELLGKTLEGVGAEAERRVADHIRDHQMGDRGQPWISEGLGYIHEDRCPFCSQNLQRVDLIDAYRAFFSEAYHGLRDEAAAMIAAIETDFGDREIARVERTVESNANSVSFWSDYCAFQTPQIPAEINLFQTLLNLREASVSLLQRKQSALLEAHQPDEQYRSAASAVEAASGSVAAYNRAVQSANTIIKTKKQETGDAEVDAVEEEFALLKAQKARHTNAVNDQCEAYTARENEKGDIERQKEETREQLNAHTEALIAHYGQSINQNLDRFHADFRISSPTHTYRGGTASSSYKILINEVPVDLGHPSTPLDQPSFRNTLSSGDRNTLALAFFFAELERDPDLAERIVILDDPFNSQDAFRQSQTVQQIKRIAERCAQVIVLSHNQHFLHMLWSRLSPADRKTIQLGRVGENNTTVSEWDIEEAVKARYRADVETLQRFYSDNEGNARDIVQKIRPVLEGFCRNLYPNQFTDADMLGGIIGKIRASGDNHSLTEIVNDLDDLNAYTSRYHHGENPNAATEPIDDGELKGSVKRTVTLVGGF